MQQLRPGDVLDRRYKVESLIGVGGMGEVYRARRTRLGDIVAIKIIRPRSGDTPALRKRFMENEARMCAMLHHPYIVSVLDFGVETGIGPYLVMEYLNGSSLKQQLDDRGAFDVPDVCRIASQIASALDLAHSQGIVHRDLKPGNVMLTRSGAKLLDFGLARATAESSLVPGPEDQATEAKPLTAAGTVLGTYQYMAPEQLAGAEAGPRTDIFTLGTVLYEDLWVDRAGGRFDKGWDAAGLASQVHARSDAAGRPTGWTVVSHLPWSALAAKAPAGATLPPKAGERWRFNAFRIERPLGPREPDKDALFLAWSPTGERSFHVPLAFREIEFAAE